MSKKVSIKEIKDFLSATDIYDVPISLTIGDKSISIVFKPYLSLSEESDFVNETVSYAFDKNGEYNSEFTDIAFTSMVLKYLSNMTLPTIKSNKNRVNLDVVKEWDNSIHFIDKIKSISTDTLIGKDFVEYIKHLEGIAYSKINYLKNQSKSDVLFETLNKLANQYGDKLKDVNIKDVTDVFNKVKGMDESKFVTAIVDKAKEDKKENKDNITKLNEVKAK